MDQEFFEDYQAMILYSIGGAFALIGVATGLGIVLVPIGGVFAHYINKKYFK